MRVIILLITIGLIGGCKHQNDRNTASEKTKSETTHKQPIALNNGKFFDVDGKRMLYGGKNSEQHFNISDSGLIEE